MHDQYIISSPIGGIQILATQYAITSISFTNSTAFNTNTHNPIIKDAVHCLTDYFSGYFLPHCDLPLAPEGTPFQQAVWKLVQTIPYGETVTYGQLAKSLGDRMSPQAVGSAISKNPILLAIPCHRVVGKNGALIGYSAGLHRKQYLLDFEKNHFQQPLHQRLDPVSPFFPSGDSCIHNY